mmetsp:Transcript_7515/g.22810  ORF Transcript_7515/g.22810 Transcript_7515/m.22810 type:complete len:90 (-) Transcript_7515:90-359(-)
MAKKEVRSSQVQKQLELHAGGHKRRRAKARSARRAAKVLDVLKAVADEESVRRQRREKNVAVLSRKRSSKLAEAQEELLGKLTASGSQR